MTSLSSTLFYNLCVVAYAIALFTYIANLVMKRAKVRRVGTIIVATGFLLQVVGMVFRWYEAGVVEVEAAERATGITLEGAQRFVVQTQHPPWSNLYEIMVYMAWGVVFVFLISEVKFRIRVAGIFALLLALTSLGLASLTTDATIKPLVPALQSWWIMIHVISSAIGYACGTMGAIGSLLYLMKARERVTLTSMAAGTLVVTTLLTLVLGRGEELFRYGVYKVKLLRELDNGVLIPAGRMAGDSFQPYYVPSPGVGILMIASVVLSLIAIGVLIAPKLRRAPWWLVALVTVLGGVVVGLPGILMKVGVINGSAFGGDGGSSSNAGVPDVPRGLPLYAYGLAFGATTATILLILVNAFTQTDYQVAPEIASTLMPPAPWRLAIQSAQWDLALFGIVWGAQLFAFIGVLMPDRLRSILPDAARLDRAAYYSILIAFALVAVVLVTGALWAHYAWGRYWGWDPKETGALIIWITYALYLHARVTYGWVGVPSAIIGVLGFFVIIAGFLGVNLGWFANGLHSYGSS